MWCCELVRGICSGRRGTAEKMGPEEIWSVIFCSGCVESSGRLNGDEESAIDIWYEGGKWIPAIFIMQQSIIGQDLLIVEASRWHSYTPHLAGLLWTSYWSIAETTTWQRTTLTRVRRRAPAGFEPEIPASERQQTHALDRKAPGIGIQTFSEKFKVRRFPFFVDLHRVTA